MSLGQGLNPLPPGGRTKPDPEEPWRYVCPECKKQVHRCHRATTFRCDNCAESYKVNELYDRKEDRLLTDHVNDNTVPK